MTTVQARCSMVTMNRETRLLLFFTGFAGFTLGLIIALCIHLATQAGVLFAQHQEWKREVYRTKYTRSIEESIVVVSAVSASVASFAIDSSRQYATVTAYSCGGLKTEAEIRMNCPSLLAGSPKTALGESPVPYATVACDKANLRRLFTLIINGEKVTVRCNDTGGAITGSGRFDLYVETVQEARAWGVQQIEYEVVEHTEVAER